MGVSGKSKSQAQTNRKTSYSDELWDDCEREYIDKIPQQIQKTPKKQQEVKPTMDLFEAIRKRRSYRGTFTDAPVAKSDLERIVQAGIQAPSGCNAQTTSFVIVDDPGVLAEIAEIIDTPVARTAKAMIVCVMNNRPVFKNTSFGPEDCAAAVENMLLAITALGYATVWLDGVLRVEKRAKRIAELLNIPETLEVRVLLPVGVPAEDGEQAPRAAFIKRAAFNDYSTIE
jgi:nitroreductase